MKCLICQLLFKNKRSVMKHVFFKHKTYTPKSYYDQFLRCEDEGICECGAETSFKGTGKGYLKFCSPTCYTNSEKTRTNMSVKASGKKQTKLTIQKRIANTDQLKKEERRKSTCIEKYGVENTSQVPEIAAKISASNLGKICLRTSEHSLKIVESRKLKGTNNHTEFSKEKISKSIKNSKKFQERKEDGTFIRAF